MRINGSAVEMTRDVDRSSTVYGYAHALYGRIHPKELPHNTAAHSQRDLLRGAGGAFSDAKLVL